MKICYKPMTFLSSKKWRKFLFKNVFKNLQFSSLVVERWTSSRLQDVSGAWLENEQMDVGCFVSFCRPPLRIGAPRISLATVRQGQRPLVGGAALMLDAGSENVDMKFSADHYPAFLFYSINLRLILHFFAPNWHK